LLYELVEFLKTEFSLRGSLVLVLLLICHRLTLIYYSISTKRVDYLQREVARILILPDHVILRLSEASRGDHVTNL
jgi:hypothetical protein